MVLKSLVKNVTDPVRKGEKKSKAAKSLVDHSQRVANQSYRSVSSYWALRNDQPQRGLGRTAAAALASSLDTTGVARDIRLGLEVSILRTTFRHQLY